MLCEKMRNMCWKLTSTAQCALEAARHCIVQTAARHTARHSTHSTHSTDRRLYESGQVSLKDRCPLAYMGLYKAAWGRVVLRYICVLVCCCKRLDACANTACQGICINVETLLKSFLNIYFIISLSLYTSSCSAVRVQQGNLSIFYGLQLLTQICFVWIGDRCILQTNLLLQCYMLFRCYLLGLLTNLLYSPKKTFFSARYHLSGQTTKAFL